MGAEHATAVSRNLHRRLGWDFTTLPYSTSMAPKSVKPKRAKPTRKAPWKKRELKALLSDFEALRSGVRTHDGDASRAIEAAHASCRASARNLLCSLALFHSDIEPLGDRLAALGLMRLERRESSALAALDAVRGLLHYLKGQTPPGPSAEAVGPEENRRLLEHHAEKLLGPKPRPGPARLLANLNTGGEGEAESIGELVAAGVDGLCIEAGQGGPEDWGRLVDRARRNAERRQRSLRVMVALAGPSIETGELAQGSAVVRWEPRRNQLGKLLRPARLWLTDENRGEVPFQPVEAVLPVSAKLLRKAQTEDTVRFEDARGRRRELRIRGAGRSGCLAEADQTTYVESGAALRLERKGKLIVKGHVRETHRDAGP